MTNTNSPIDFFSSISDPRVERTQKHSLDAILFISLCAVICGAEGWNEIEDYGNAKIDWLEKFLHLPNGIPSHDTFNRVISMLDPKELNDSFVAWTKSIAGLQERATRLLPYPDFSAYSNLKTASSQSTPWAVRKRLPRQL